MNLNFKMSELIHSDKAIQHNINNMPDINSLDCMLDLIVYCLQPIREKIGKPMIITSGYRNAQVNKLVGGVDNSEHKLGMAADFVVSGMTPAQIIAIIRKSNVKFTQLIEEHSGNSHWTHVSFNKNNLKCETLLYKNGKYIKI